MLRTKNVTLVIVNSNDALKKAFGKWLQTEREKTGVTQDQVAEETDLNVKSISRIERGESGTKKSTLINIVEAINKLSHGYQIKLSVALQKYGYTPHEMSDDELVSDGLFDGYYELSDKKRALARRQIAAIIRSLKEEDFEE